MIYYIHHTSNISCTTGDLTLLQISRCSGSSCGKWAWSPGSVPCPWALMLRRGRQGMGSRDWGLGILAVAGIRFCCFSECFLVILFSCWVLFWILLEDVDFLIIDVWFDDLHPRLAQLLGLASQDPSMWWNWFTQLYKYVILPQQLYYVILWYTILYYAIIESISES